MIMDVLNVDVWGIRRKTSRVPELTTEERTRVGGLLQERRGKQTQGQIAKKLGCSISTVQNIEYNKVPVDRDTIEKYAALFGKTAHQLLNPESTMIAPSDPRYVDLNHQHLQIARRYMRAVDEVRAAVRVLLSDNDAVAEEFADLVLGLKRASDTARDPAGLRRGLQILIDHDELVQRLAQRFEDSPEFAALLLDLINNPDTP